MASLAAAQEQNTRNMRDFLQLYNKLTEQCFSQCVTSFYNRALDEEEKRCVGICANRYVNFNQRLTIEFMDFQNAKQEAAIKEMEKAAASGQSTNLPGVEHLGGLNPAQAPAPT